LGYPGIADTDAFIEAVPNPAVQVYGAEHIQGLWLSAGSTAEDSDTSEPSFE